MSLSLSSTFQLVGFVASYVLLVTQSAVALTSGQITAIAEKITVLIGGSSELGSGFIINRKGNTYSVLTNWHVVANPETHYLRTVDNQKYEISSKQIQKVSSGLDLAIVSFSSTSDYRPASISGREVLEKNQTLFISGFPKPTAVNPSRTHTLIKANIFTILPSPIREGYAIGYGGLSLEGMSGGPVLNEDGYVVGIHGLADINGIIGSVGNYAIPINAFLKTQYGYLATLGQPPIPTQTPKLPNSVFIPIEGDPPSISPGPIYKPEEGPSPQISRFISKD